MKIRISATTTVFLLSLLALLPHGVLAQPAPGNDLAIDAKTRETVIASLLESLTREYVFPDVAKTISTEIRKRVERKDYEKYETSRALADKLTADLREIGKDKHLRVVFRPEDRPPMNGPRRLSPEEMEVEIARMKSVNFGFAETKKLDGNIGYINLKGFFDPRFAGATAAETMNSVAGTDALIIDLRENGGGSPEMVRLLCSYLLGEKPVHLNDMKWRDGRADEFWTLETVPGKRYKNDVYLLTSSRTFSAGEEFTYNLKNLKRVVVIGETTGGGANPGREFPLAPHFTAFIPTGRAVNPITKTNWEGVGIKPDVAVAREDALNTALELARTKSRPKSP